MTKRNTGAFARNHADFYPTPPEAVRPLLPHISDVREFAEPCAGDGSLMRALEAVGLHCAYHGDFNHGGRNALTLDTIDLCGADTIITNPPYLRPLMHALIAHFVRIVPSTWLLLELDWFATVQSAPYARMCGDIVPIGRLKWIPNSRSVGFDNYCWAHFGRNNTITRFHPRQDLAASTVVLFK